MTENTLSKKQRMILEAILFLIGKGELPTVREVGSLVGLRSPATVLKHLRFLEKASLISLSGKSRGIRIADPDLLNRVIENTAERPLTAPRSPPPQSPPAVLPAECPPPAESSAEPSIEPSDKRLAVGSSRGRPLDVLQSHLPGLARLTSRPGGRRGPLPKIPLVGAIAAGHPFESYSDGYLRGEFGYDELGYDEFSSSDFSESRARSTGTVSDESPTIEIDPRAFCENGDVLALKVEGDSMVNAGILDGDYAIIRRQNTVEEGEIAAVIINGEGTLKRWSTGKSSISLRPENDSFDPIEITEEEGKDVLVIGKYVGLVRGIQPLM